MTRNTPWNWSNNPQLIQIHSCRSYDDVKKATQICKLLAELNYEIKKQPYKIPIKNRHENSISHPTNSHQYLILIHLSPPSRELTNPWFQTNLIQIKVQTTNIMMGLRLSEICNGGLRKLGIGNGGNIGKRKQCPAGTILLGGKYFIIHHKHSKEIEQHMFN